MGQVMLEQHPYILIWYNNWRPSSVRSLEAKLIFVRDRLKLPINMNTLELLAYSFGYTLRPRGDILVKAKIEFNESDILTYFRMT